MEICALTIYGEARGEPIHGQIAVGCVIRNRVIRRKKTYVDICLQPLQFSCWNKNDPNRVVLEEFAELMLKGQEIKQPFLNQAIWIAQGIVNELLMDNTKGADHYLTNKLYSSVHNSHWSKKLNMTVLINNHIFLT